LTFGIRQFVTELKRGVKGFSRAFQLCCAMEMQKQRAGGVVSGSLLAKSADRSSILLGYCLSSYFF